MSYFNSVFYGGIPIGVASSPLPTDLRASPCLGPETSTVTVLKSVLHPVTKSFFIDENGHVRKENFQNAATYTIEQVPVHDIESLATLIERCSHDPHELLIRGLPRVGLTRRERRTKESFPEHRDGTPWVMLDFDDIPVPEGVDPLSGEAIEWVVTKLPVAFHNASYFYQHSSSAGVLDHEGEPLKAGLNVHLFFWLDRRIPGEPLSFYLNLHCMQTDFYSLGENKGGVVGLRFGIDPAPIRCEVQPHFVAEPILGDGVRCLLAAGTRQGLIQKALPKVTLAEIPPDIQYQAKTLKRKLVTDYKLAHGYVLRTSQTRTTNGVSTSRYYQKPGQNREAKTGRPFRDAKLSDDEKYLTLYFDDEGSPGSWYVSRARPQMGKRYGDGSELLLKELSIGAHEYVRDVLRWFTEVPHQTLALQEGGYLPPLQSFVEARINLVLSPTGSGKTTATIDWINERLSARQIVIYAAPTIAIVQQMRGDLRDAGLSSHYYAEVTPYDLPPGTGSVIVTTNESLPKMVVLAEVLNQRYSVIFDEVHMALDEFAKGDRRLSNFEATLSKASKTLLLTGTITDVQQNFLVECVKQAVGVVNAETYCCYQFDPVKQNPLEIWPLSYYDNELGSLLAELGTLKKAGQPLPRTVLLLDTSKMAMYRQLIEQHGLSDETEIVSRPESTPKEIETARVSTKPILISSPLFGLGLNFTAQPDILWARFDHVSADTNQIVQAVNRANRGSTLCAVRIFGNPSDQAIQIPKTLKVREDVRERIQEEGTLAGCLEEHLQIDRVTYSQLRMAERDSQRALGELVRHNAIQNFSLQQPVLPEIDKDLAGIVKAARKGGREHYDAQVLEAKDPRNKGLLSFVRYDDLKRRKQTNYRKKSPQEDSEHSPQVDSEHSPQVDSEHSPQLDRVLENEEIALMMSICDLTAPADGRAVVPRKVMALFGETVPWLSGQYQPGSDAYWPTAVEKTERIIPLLRRLERLRAGLEDAQSLSVALTRGDDMKNAFLALASGEADYHRVAEQIARLKQNREKVRVSGGKSERETVAKQGLELLRTLLQPLGIRYGKKEQNGRMVTDLSKPIVPPSWDIEEMIWKLERQAYRLDHLPAYQEHPIIAADEDNILGGLPKPRDLCVGCAFFHESACVRGERMDWQSSGTVGYATECPIFIKMPETLAARLR